MWSSSGREYETNSGCSGNHIYVQEIKTSPEPPCQRDGWMDDDDDGGGGDDDDGGVCASKCC